MLNVPAATPAETGANKGKVQSFKWLTSITPDQNATGLPIDSAKNVAVLEIPGDSFEVAQFENVTEVREAAGEHFDTWVLTTANRDFRRDQITERMQTAKKMTVAPADPLAWVKGFAANAAALFAPTVRADSGKKSAQAQIIAQAAQNLDSLSRDDLAALILRLAAQK